MLVDANLLLYAVDERNSRFEAAATWWEASLNGDRRVALPWQTIGAFIRIVTHPRITINPMAPSDAWEMIESWLAAPQVWIPAASERTARILGALVTEHSVTANLIPDAQLAALAIEHGLVVHSADTDFGRFPTCRWVNPLN